MDEASMSILKVQPNVDPRGYRLSKALASATNLRIRSAAYSSVHHSPFFQDYALETIFFGPAKLREGVVANWLNAFLHQSDLVMWSASPLLARRIKRMAKSVGATVLHTTGTPDLFGFLGKKYSDLPVIHEVYDTYSLFDAQVQENTPFSLMHNPLTVPISQLRRKNNLFWEEYVHRKCDALVFTSEEMRKRSQEKYGDFLSVVIPNGVLHEFLPKERLQKLSRNDGLVHCVYLGAIRPSVAHRNILPLISQIATSREVVVHLYPTTKSQKQTEDLQMKLNKHLNVVFHSPLHYQELYREISQYDLGLVLLSPHDERLLNVAVPNKIFEYVSMGLPVAVPPYEALSNFVKKYRCGFIVTDWRHGISENSGQVKEVSFRDEFTIDYHVPKLIELYKRFGQMEHVSRN